MLERGPFKFTASLRDGIHIKRDNTSMLIAGAEADNFISAIHTVMRIESYPLLPATLSVPPFMLHFSVNRTIEIRRNGQDPNTSGIMFSFREGDDLIWAITQAKNHYIGLGKVAGPIKGLRPSSLPDPIS